MAQDLTKLYDVLLDNHDAPVDTVIKELEQAIADLKPYNHGENNIKIACNINLTEKDTSAISADDVDKVSQEVEILEKLFTKREAVFMLVGMQRQMSEFRKMGKFLGKLKGLMDDEE